MKIGIAGLSASGKSTIFSSFLGGMESSGAKKSTSGVVNVPDERLERFTAMFNPKKTVYATVIFEDLLPLDTHAKNDRIKLADRLKIMDALVLVVGAYRCVDGEDALKEFNKLRFELIMNDLDFVTKRIERLERETRVSNKDRGDKEKEMDLLRRLQPVLEGEKFLRGMDFAEQDAAMMVNYNLITVKPACYVINFSDDMSKEEVEKVRLGGENFLRDAGEDSPLLCVNAALEEELSSMGPDEISQFMGEYGIEEMGRDRVIKSAFSMLNLLTFFTVGEDECRSWHIHKGETALDAAGAIHSDLARGFIRAEVIGGETLLDLGSMNEAKKAGKLRLEGKTYVVNDGDIVHVMFNI